MHVHENEIELNNLEHSSITADYLCGICKIVHNFHKYMYTVYMYKLRCIFNVHTSSFFKFMCQSIVLFRDHNIYQPTLKWHDYKYNSFIHVHIRGIEPLPKRVHPSISV